MKSIRRLCQLICFSLSFFYLVATDAAGVQATTPALKMDPVRGWSFSPANLKAQAKGILPAGMQGTLEPDPSLKGSSAFYNITVYAFARDKTQSAQTQMLKAMNSVAPEAGKAPTASPSASELTRTREVAFGKTTVMMYLHAIAGQSVVLVIEAELRGRTQKNPGLELLQSSIHRFHFQLK